MEFKEFKVTAINFEIRKSVTITVDMKKMSRYKTLEAVKKALDNLILETRILSKDDMTKVKYQGRKEVLDEWKAIRPSTAEKEAKEEQSEYNLDRFLDAQKTEYPIALQEMKEGQKVNHWIWYIFPQKKGLGRSYNSEYYGLDGIGEATAYLHHPVLGQRLREICQALLDNEGKNIRSIMGSDIDVIKLKSSMKLFDVVSPNDIFRKVLNTFF